MKEINVLYSSNNIYLKMMLASMYSFVLNSKFEIIKFHIITENFTTDDYKLIEDIMSKFPNVSLSFYSIESYHLEKYGIPEWRGTQIPNARLFFQKIMDKNIADIKNLLYLDADTIVIDSLNEIGKYNKGLYAVKDACLTNYYKSLNNLDTYYNSGVIYIDVNEWANNNYQEKILDFIKNNSQIKLSYPDQDILNCVLSNEIKPLPPTYNVGPYGYIFNDSALKIYYKKRNTPFEEVIAARDNAKILHSYGFFGIKPWMKNKVHPFNEQFCQYLKETDPSFEVVDMPALTKILTFNPQIFYNLLLLKACIPNFAQDSVKTLSLKINNRQSKHNINKINS